MHPTSGRRGTSGRPPALGARLVRRGRRRRPRWLLHSLRDQYRSTLTAAPPGTETASAAEGAAAETSQGRDDNTVQEDADRLMLSTPHDYLEKIFNVPFVLPA